MNVFQKIICIVFLAIISIFGGIQPARASSNSFDLRELLNKNEDYISLTSEADLKKLDGNIYAENNDKEIDVYVDGGIFTSEGFLIQQPTGGIQIKINRSVPVERMVFSVKMRGLVPDSFDEAPCTEGETTYEEDVNPHNERDEGKPGHAPCSPKTVQHEAVIGGWGTQVWETKGECENWDLGARYKLWELECSPDAARPEGEFCTPNVNIGDHVDPFDPDSEIIDERTVLRTDTISGWQGAINPATKFLKSYPYPRQPYINLDGSEEVDYPYPDHDPRGVWYQYEYKYGGDVLNLSTEFDRTIYGKTFKLGDKGNNGNDGNKIGDASTSLNWDLRERDDLKFGIGEGNTPSSADDTAPGLVFDELRFHLEHDVIPPDYVPELPYQVPNAENPKELRCEYPSDAHDDDIYDQFSCVSSVLQNGPKVSGQNVAERILAKEDSPIFHPVMNFKERDPQILDPAKLDFDLWDPLGGFAFARIELKYKLGNWFSATQALKKTSDVDVMLAPGSVVRGQPITVRAKNQYFKGDEDNVYTSWCVDGVPNQGLAAGGRLIKSNDAIDAYPAGQKLVQQDVDFNRDDVLDSDIRPCCRLVTRTPAPGDDKDKDGMSDAWEQRYFPTVIINIDDISQLEKVNPFDDSDNDFYLADSFKKRDTFFFSQLIKPGDRQSRLPILRLYDLLNSIPRKIAGTSGPNGYEDERYDLLHSVPFLLSGADVHFNEIYRGPGENNGRELFPPIRNVPNSIVKKTIKDGAEKRNVIFKTGEGSEFSPGKFTNLEEYIYGTDPKNPDTDGDGFSDGEEIAGLGSYDFTMNVEDATASKHSVRATTLGYSDQNLLEFDSDEREFFVSKGEKIEVELTTKPTVVSPLSYLELQAHVYGNIVNENGLIYNWHVFDTNGAPFPDDRLGGSPSGRGKNVLTIPQDVIVSGLNRVEVVVLEETSHKTGQQTFDVAVQQPITLGWSYIADAGESKIEACAQNFEGVEHPENLNFVWFVDQKRDVEQSGVGKSLYTFQVNPRFRSRQYNLELKVYDKETSDLRALLRTAVSIATGSGGEMSCHASQRRALSQPRGVSSFSASLSTIKNGAAYIVNLMKSAPSSIKPLF